MGKRKQKQRHEAVFNVLKSWARGSAINTTGIEWNALADRVLDRLAAVKMSRARKPKKRITKRKAPMTRRVTFGLLYVGDSRSNPPTWEEQSEQVPIRYCDPMTWWHWQHAGGDTREIEHVVVLCDPMDDEDDEEDDDGFDSRLHGAD